MKKKLGILLVVALFILASITLVSCTMFGGGSSTTERSEIKESHGYPFALEITSPAASKSSAIGIDDFNLSMVKAKIRYQKTIKGPTGEDVFEYWTDDSSEFTLDNKNVEVTNPWVLSDLEALAQEKNTVFVRYDSNLKDQYGYNVELTGSFVLYLRQSESVSYSKIKFNPNGGIVGFAGSVNSDGSVTATVRTGTSYTWSDFIATYPVTPPTGKALSAWGHYSSGSSIHVDSDMDLTAEWTDNFLTVSFAVNNTSTDYTSVPVKPADQPVQIRDGFIARPQTKTMETFNGYDFIDWYQDPECTKKWNFTADLKNNGRTTAENFTLYAKWEERKFTIKFNLMDGLLGSEQLQEIVTGEATTDYIIPEIERSNFAVASYVTYTNDAGAVSYINITTTPKASARRLVFNNRVYPLTSSLAAGDYYFDYQGERYYFSTSSALATSEKGLQIGCAPATVTYSNLKVGDKYFTKTQGNYSGGLLLATDTQNLEDSKDIYKGLATFLDANDNNIYFYEFKGWYTSPTFDEDTLFLFANNDGTSREIVLGDYERNASGFVLQLYAKWMVVNNEYRDLYLSDYLFKDTLSLKADGTVAITGISDSSANIITIPKTIKYDFDGDGEFDIDSSTNAAKDFVITEIGYKAFYGNSKIVEIAFDNDSQITTIGDNAFAYCTSLTNINIFSLDNVTDIGSNILKGTSWLTNYMTEKVPYYVTYTNGTDPVEYINITTTEKVGATEIVFDELQHPLTTPLSVGDYYFEYDNNNYYFTINSELAASETGLQILDGTHEYLVLNHILIQYTGAIPISGYVNMNQSKELAKINHDNGATTIISSGAFAGLQKLLVIEILDSIETIENLAFQGASKLLAVEFTENTHLETVGESAFYQTAWVAGTKEIDESTGLIYTYEMMKEFDDSVDFYKASDTGEFKEAKSPLNEADFVKNGPYFKRVEKHNEDLCLVLGNIYYRFVGASNKSYTTATIPTTYNGNTITKIAANAFAGYSNIKNINFGDKDIFVSPGVKNIESIGQNAFSDTSWSKISKHSAANNFVEGDAGITYVSEDGFCVINGILVEYFGTNSAAIIPTNVKHIAKGVLSKKSGSVTNVLIPLGSNLESIDDYAFINATSLRGISFLDENIPEHITFSERAFFTSTTGVSSTNGLTFYFTLPVGYADLDAYMEVLQADPSLWALLKSYTKIFKYSVLQATKAEINPNLGIPTKYLVDSADPNALDISEEWQRLKLNDYVTSGPGAPYFTNGLKITRNDGVSTLQDLYLELDQYNYIYTYDTMHAQQMVNTYTFSASDIPSDRIYGTFAIKFVAEGVPENIATPYEFSVYPGIKSVEFSGLRSVYYTSQNELPKVGDNYWVKVTLYNNKVDYFRLDNEPFEEGPFHWVDKDKVYETDFVSNIATSEDHAKTAVISILNYSNTRGPAKSLSISITYNGLTIYNYSHTYSTEEAAVVSFEQASSFLFAANSNASLKYSDCYFKLKYQDDTTKLISMNMSRNFSVYKVFMESENPYGPKNSYVEMDYLDTTDLGLRQAKIKYEGIDEPVTILYIVYIGTLPEVFTYDFKVVGGEYVATITGISSAFNNTYDATLVLPASVVRSESIDPLTYDNKEYKVVAIGDSAFKNKTKLTDVYIANTITSIGNYAFAGCEKLVNVFTFEMGTNKSASSNPTYYYGPNNSSNSIEAYSETATYYARAYITNIIPESTTSALVVPFTIEGKSGVEEVETNIKMETQQAVYNGKTFKYDVNYSYVLTPTIEYKYVDILDGDNNPTGEKELECVLLSALNNFEGKLYLPKTAYNIALKQALEEEVGESGLGYTIYLYEENEKDIPNQTTSRLRFKGSTDAAKSNVDIDMCYRTGNVVLLENAQLPIEEQQVYIPGHFNGNYEASKNIGTIAEPEYDTYNVYYDYTLTSIMDSCLGKSYNDGMREVYVPYTIFNVWCDIDDFLLYAPDMNTYMADNTLDPTNATDVQTAVTARIAENYNRVKNVTKYQYTAGSLLTSELVRSAETGSYVAHTSSYDGDTAYAVAQHFSSAVKVIGESAFAGCVLLRYIDFSEAESLEEIGAAAFEGCAAFGKDYDMTQEPPILVDKVIDLSNTKLESIESNVFSGCTSLVSIKIPNTVTEICSGAFQETAITSFEVSGGTTSESLTICDYAFYLVNIADKAAFISALEGIYLGGVDVNMDLAFSQGD